MRLYIWGILFIRFLWNIAINLNCCIDIIASYNFILHICFLHVALSIVGVFWSVKQSEFLKPLSGTIVLFSLYHLWRFLKWNQLLRPWSLSPRIFLFITSCNILYFSFVRHGKNIIFLYCIAYMLCYIMYVITQFTWTVNN